jgi:signal transduction histidine kinase/ligand-binding sensor domain-containing protein
MINCRHRLVARALLMAAVLGFAPRALALNPRLDISQYAHTSWRIGDGFVGGPITTIAQTSDGYLWLGTNDGLFRFDGVKATPWLVPGQELPSQRIIFLLATADGSLWISTERGLASLRNGTLRNYVGPEEQYRTGKLVQDREGEVWGVVYLPRLNRSMLCSFSTGRAECHGLDGGAGAGAIGLYAGSNGRLWVGTAGGVWRWKPAPARFYPLEPEMDGFQGMAEDASGGLLISRRGRVQRLHEGRVQTAHLLPAASGRPQFDDVIADRDGGLWLGSSSEGLLHIHQGIVDAFGEADGLSSDFVYEVFEDREGSIWVATSEGLDRFRDVAVVTVSKRQGLSNLRANAVLSDPDGSVWVSTFDGLNRVTDNAVTVYRQPGSAPDGARASRPVRYVDSTGLPGTGVQCIFRDRLGRIWVSTESGVGYFEGNRLVMVNGVPGGLTRSITEDDDGTIWVASQREGLFRISQGRADPRSVPWTAFDHTEPATVALGDPRGSGVWLGFGLGGLVHFDNGKVAAAYGTVDGLAAGRVHAMHFDADGALWVAADGGLSRLKDGRLATLNSRSGLPCDAVHWAIRDNTNSLWMSMQCGLVRVAAAELTAWDSPERHAATRSVRVSVIGNASGFRALSGTGYTAPVAKSNDGRLWFRAAIGVSVLDPGFVPANRVVPPVHIEAFIADRRRYHDGSTPSTAVRLPPLTRDVQIDYTALSLVAPEQVQFRYRLEGRDTDWQNVGNRRQAFYSDLSPGTYRFRVIASNNDGVWNEEGAAIGFEIAATYYQTNWFIALVAGMLLTLIWAAHRIRLRIVETHEREITALNEKLMSAQEQERIRIAGELHDGVMQEMLAATMMLGTAKRRLGDDSAAHATIDKVQQKLVQAGTEIRQLSHDLHPPALQEAGLPDALRLHCEQFSTSCGIPITCDVDDRVHDLSRGAALALFRIVQEALGNAAKHSKATRITVGLTRSNGHVTLIVSDNGVGFDRGLLTSSGGLGLITMRERAGQLNGTFEFTTAPGRGTTITVIVPFR